MSPIADDQSLSDELKRLGDRERKTLFFETRNVRSNRAALQPAVTELMGKKVNVIFTTGTSATRAAMATTAWFFPYQQVDDWRMLAYSTTDGKGFSYPLMCRTNIFYAIAYLIALVAAIPYWRYLE